ncbi:MAG: Ig domain-containing protein [Candidatus Pristimantibacillus sp.]
MKETRRWLAAVLAFVLVMTSLSGIAHAAEDTVTGIDFKYDSTDYVDGKIAVFVDDDKVDLTLYASISGSSSQKDVTLEATWKSSNTSNVKVDKGVLTGVGKGTATITATYKGYTTTITANSAYIYEDITMMQGSATAPETLDIELGQSLKFTLDGKKSSTESIDVTDEAVWTTSSASVATVDDGEITLVGTGTATITAKLKGKTDSIKLTVTSPYKSITISPKELLELSIGYDDAKLTASVEAKTGVTSTVTDIVKWTSGNTQVATVDKGVVSPVGTGKTTITASYMGVTTSIDVVVRTAYQSIKLSPDKEIHLQLHDADTTIEASVLDNTSATPISITSHADAVWKSSNVIVATVENGIVSPKAVGSTKISVSYKGLSRSVDVTVYPRIFKLTAETEKLDGFIESTDTLPKITATTFDGEQVDVTKLVEWTSEDPEIVKIENGKYVAKAIGETTLTARAQDFTVEVPFIVHVKPLKLIADTKEMSIILGQEVPLPTVTVINTDGEEVDVTTDVAWKSSSDNMLLKASTMKGLEASTVTLTATYLKKTVTVRVKIEEEIVKFVVEPTSLDLYPGKSKSVKVTGYYKSGSKISLGSKMNWVVSSSELASVRGASVKALAVGTGKITGSYQGKTVTIPIVVSPKLKSLVLSEKSAKLGVGAAFTVKLQAVYTTGSPIDATSSAVWTSSKSSVATVKDGKITAVSKGSASIKATFAGKTVTFRVTVK